MQRMANHRRRCGGSIRPQGASKEIQKLVQSKIEDDAAVEHQEQDQEDILWSSPQLEEFVEEPIHVEQVNRTAIEIINEDISRHRRSSKAKRQSSSQVIDASLSSFLIGCNLTFDIVDSIHFKSFANSLNPNYTIPSSAQLKARVISQLQSLESSEERYKPLRKRNRRYESSDSSN